MLDPHLGCAMLILVMNNHTLLRIQEIRKENKSVLVDFMQKNGIESVSIEFDGSGDSGQMESVQIHPSDKDHVVDQYIPFIRFYQRYDGGQWNIIEELKQVAFQDAVDDFAYSLLENNHDGWEINEGSYGEIIINANGSGRIEFNQRVMETEFDETEF